MSVEDYFDFSIVSGVTSTADLQVNDKVDGVLTDHSAGRMLLFKAGIGAGGFLF